jgi:hypothetical protein
MRSITPKGGNMNQTPNPDSVLGQPQGRPASATTHWGNAPPVPAISQFLQGRQKRSFETGTRYRHELFDFRNLFFQDWQ